MPTIVSDRSYVSRLQPHQLYLTADEFRDLKEVLKDITEGNDLDNEQVEFVRTFYNVIKTVRD